MLFLRRDWHAHYLTSTSQAEHMSARYMNTDHFQTNYLRYYIVLGARLSRSPRRVSTGMGQIITVH